MGDVVWGGRYQSQAVVGSTSAGQLHTGWDRSLHRPVSLGILNGVTREKWDALLQDIRTAAGRSWTSLPEIYDVGIENDTAYIVYSHIAGRSFWEQWCRDGSADLRSWAKWLLQIGESAEQWQREGVRMLSIDPRWLWIDDTGHLWFYGLGVEETPLSRQLARLAAQLATGQTDPPLYWDVLEHHFTPKADVPGLWIRAFGHWWLRAISKDPEMQFPDVESCVSALREVVGEAAFSLAENQLSAVVSENRAKAFQPDTVATADIPSSESDAGKRSDNQPSRMRPDLRKRLGEGFRRFQWSKVSTWILVSILAVFGGASLGYAVFMRGSNEVTMPFVVGKPYNEAVSELVKAGLDPSKVVKEPQPSTQPPGTVIAQDPFGGKVIKGDRLVHLQVAVAPSSPPPGTTGRSEPGDGVPSQRSRSNSNLQNSDKTVPDLTGLTLQEAQNQLLSLGIHYRYEIVASDRPKDTVIEQNPSPGTRVGNNDEVVFRVSRGS